MDEENSLDEPKSDEMFQKLRDWQHQQHQRLIEQQQQQRLMLMDQQKKLLTMINSSGNESSLTSSLIEDVHMVSNNRPIIPSQPTHSKAFTSVDDVPLKKPRSVKTFDQLLETSLTKSKQSKSDQEEPQARKFPFLKRGQGISRFGQIPKPTARPQAGIVAKKIGKENKLPASAATNQPCTSQPKRFPPTICKERNTMDDEVRDIQIQQNIEKVEPIKSVETTNQMLPYQPNTANEAYESYMRQDVNSSRNGEDLAVFELLERFASINASFSSSSSLIGQLIDKGVTHLPSPSKVMNFLSQKHNYQEISNQQPAKIVQGKHVHFAESLEISDANDVEAKEEEEEENPSTYPSPYVSNTIPVSHQRFTKAKLAAPTILEEDSNLDETPTSPLGFPDFNKLFGNAHPRSLWSKEEETQMEECVKAKSTENVFNPNLELTDHMLPTTLSSDNPRLIYQSSVLRSRLSSLEREIATYRRESEALRRSRKENEESKLKLDQEQDKFRRYAENEKRRMQLLYSEEQKRLRSDQLKDANNLKGNEDELEKLREELKQVKEEHRVKEGKWMSNQTKVQEKIRLLEQRNRELTDSLDKLRQEEQSLRRRLNASLRPGAVIKKNSPTVTERNTEVQSQPDPMKIPHVPTEAPQTTPVSKLSDPKTPTTVVVKDNSPDPRLSAGGEVSQTLLPDGTKLILYPNGNRKEIWPNGKGTQVIYYNGDIKQKLADGSIVYTYADSGTKHTTTADGTEILEFTSGQIETTYKDGRSQVQYLGGALKTKYPDGREEAQWPDGTQLWTDGKGHGVMTFPSGMREIYTPICKRREYPDGTVKTVYEDGRSETRYGNGRIRVKDKDGHIITDTGEAIQN